MKKEIFIGSICAIISAIITYLLLSGSGSSSKEDFDALVNQMIKNDYFQEFLDKEVNSEIKVLGNQLDSLRAEMGNINSQLASMPESPVILGAARIEDGEIISASEGISYEAWGGLVTFQNPDKMIYAPLITHFYYEVCETVRDAMLAF